MPALLGGGWKRPMTGDKLCLMSQKLSFPDQLMATYITLNVASASLDIFWIYAGKANRKHLPDHVLDSYQKFIVFDREAHLRTAVIALMTLFDHTGKTITLDRMIKNSGIDAGKAKKLLVLIKDLSPRIKKLGALRHLLYAHRNHAAVHNNVFAEVKLSRNDIEIVLKAAIRIVNALARETSSPHYLRNRDARDDLIRLLKRADV